MHDAAAKHFSGVVMSTNETIPQADGTSANPLLSSVDADLIAETIKAAGCAVSAIEQDGTVRLHSASHGVGFQVLWGNRLADGSYIDFTLSCPLRVQGGTLPENLLSEWHRANRFARMALHGDFLVLEMDVIVAGGVGPDYLSFALRLWIQMMGQFLVYLRNYRPADDVPGEPVSQEGAA
jgi:hypothetical protein